MKFDPTLVGVKTESELFNDFILYQNFPNPFNPSTKIRFSISDLPDGKAGFGFVSLKVYDVLSNEIAVLISEEKQPGVYEVEFNAASHSGLSGINGLSSGIYFYQLKAGSFIQTKKMVYLK